MDYIWSDKKRRKVKKGGGTSAEFVSILCLVCIDPKFKYGQHETVLYHRWHTFRGCEKFSPEKIIVRNFCCVLVKIRMRKSTNELKSRNYRARQQYCSYLCCVTSSITIIQIENTCTFFMTTISIENTSIMLGSARMSLTPISCSIRGQFIPKKKKWNKRFSLLGMAGQSTCVLLRIAWTQLSSISWIAEYFYKIELKCRLLRTARMPLALVSCVVEYFYLKKMCCWIFLLKKLKCIRSGTVRSLLHPCRVY